MCQLGKLIVLYRYRWCLYAAVCHRVVSLHRHRYWSLCVCLSLSLSHTHTYTLSLSLFLSLSLSLSVSPFCLSVCLSLSLTLSLFFHFSSWFLSKTMYNFGKPQIYFLRYNNNNNNNGGFLYSAHVRHVVTLLALPPLLPWLWYSFKIHVVR